MINIIDNSINNKKNKKNKKNKLKSSNSFDNILTFSDELDKINILSNKIEQLFWLSNSCENFNTIDELDNINPITFNYIYDKEIERGNIEYKRSLESYNKNDKTNKLIRQIYWRIYQGIVSIGKECCYYIIGIEDSGSPSFLTKKELFNSLGFIVDCISNTELNISFILIKNTLLNYDYIIVKFWPKVSNIIDYF